MVLVDEVVHFLVHASHDVVLGSEATITRHLKHGHLNISRKVPRQDNEDVLLGVLGDNLVNFEITRRKHFGNLNSLIKVYIRTFEIVRRLNVVIEPLFSDLAIFDESAALHDHKVVEDV